MSNIQTLVDCIAHNLGFDHCLNEQGKITPFLIGEFLLLKGVDSICYGEEEKNQLTVHVFGSEEYSWTFEEKDGQDIIMFYCREILATIDHENLLQHFKAKK